MTQFWGVDADPTAQGRLKGAQPVAVLDIGSNSVRLVVYERHARSLTPQMVGDTLGALLKYQDDIARMQGDTLQKVLKEATSEN